MWDVKIHQALYRAADLPYFTPDKLEAYKDGNPLKGGIVFADAITNGQQSNTYAEEISFHFMARTGRPDAFRAGSLRGIVNGIDYDEFNPETDTYIAQNYNAKNFRKEKIKEQEGAPAGS